MRPDSHREQTHQKCCGNCKYAFLHRRFRDLLCFHGDNIKTKNWSWISEPKDIKIDVILDGDNVENLEGEQYGEIWAGRIIDSSDICDEWEE